MSKITIKQLVKKPKSIAILLLIFGVLNFGILLLMSSKAEKQELKDDQLEKKNRNKNTEKFHILSKSPPTYNINDYLTAEEALSGFFEFQKESTSWLQYILSYQNSKNFGNDIWKENEEKRTQKVDQLEKEEIFQKQKLEEYLSQFRSIVYVGQSGGLGNRLRGLAGTLLLAMLSGRVLFVDWSEPIPLEFLFELDNLGSWDLNGADEHLIHEFILPTNKEKSLQNIAKFTLMEYEKPKTTAQNERLLQYTDNMRFLFPDSKQTVLIKTYSPFYEHLWQNNNIKRGLKQMFGTPNEFLSFSLMNLIEPSFNVHQVIHSVTSENDIEYDIELDQGTAFNRFILGVQLRTGKVYSNRPFLGDPTIEQIRQCVITTLQELIQARDNQEYHPLLQQYRKRKGYETIRFALFLSTDDEKQYAKWKCEIGSSFKEDVRIFWIDEPVIHSGTEFRHADKRKGMDSDQSLYAHIKVGADFWVLANSNLLFTTQYSSFGKVASLINSNENFSLPKRWPSCCTKHENEYKKFRDKNKLAEA